MLLASGAGPFRRTIKRSVGVSSAGQEALNASATKANAESAVALNLQSIPPGRIDCAIVRSIKPC